MYERLNIMMIIIQLANNLTHRQFLMVVRIHKLLKYITLAFYNQSNIKFSNLVATVKFISKGKLQMFQ